MKLNEDGGIEIYIAAEQPESVPAENWLPTQRRDEELNIQMRLYNPDLDLYKTWSPPQVEMIK